MAGEGGKDVFSLFTLYHIMFKTCFSLAWIGKFLIRSVMGLPGKRTVTWPKKLKIKSPEKYLNFQGQGEKHLHATRMIYAL